MKAACTPSSARDQAMPSRQGRAGRSAVSSALQHFPRDSRASHGNFRLTLSIVLERKMALAGDLITNVVASFVFEGIKRCYGTARTTIRWRETINRALDGQHDNRNKTAASGLQIWRWLSVRTEVN